LSRVPTWKYLLSFWSEQTLERIQSGHNPPLSVTIHFGRIKLDAPNAIYSYDDLYATFANTFQKMGMDKRKPEHILMLGFGLGSIPRILEKRYELKPRITAVELDHVILELAEKYYQVSDEDRIQLHNMDARDFVMGDSNSYDMIIIDLFIDDVVPDVVKDEAFLRKIDQLLAPGGVMLFNHLATRPVLEAAAKQYEQEVFKVVMPEGEVMHIGSNRMMIFDKPHA
jgi:spermidine synthase